MGAAKGVPLPALVLSPPTETAVLPEQGRHRHQASWCLCRVQTGAHSSPPAGPGGIATTTRAPRAWVSEALQVADGLSETGEAVGAGAVIETEAPHAAAVRTRAEVRALGVFRGINAAETIVRGALGGAVLRPKLSPCRAAVYGEPAHRRHLAVDALRIRELLHVVLPRTPNEVTRSKIVHAG